MMDQLNQQILCHPGSGYVTYLGARMLMASFKGRNSAPRLDGVPRVGALQAWRQGFMVGLITAGWLVALAAFFSVGRVRSVYARASRVVDNGCRAHGIGDSPGQQSLKRKV